MLTKSDSFKFEIPKSSLKRFLRKFLFYIFAYIFQQRHFQFLNFASNLAQGKGWGSSTIKKEVDSCLFLLGHEPDIFFDIGANKGIYTEELLRRLKNKSIIKTLLFEPSKTNINYLNKKFNEYENIKVVPYALSDSEKICTLYADEPGSGGASMSELNYSNFDKNKTFTEEIKTIRFDQYWGDDNKDLIIDYVKIDVEGHELSVLKGFGKLINKIKLIQFEFGHQNIETRTFFRDFWDFFKANNFELYRITPFNIYKLDNYVESEEVFTCTNYIALRK